MGGRPGAGARTGSACTFVRGDKSVQIETLVASAQTRRAAAARPQGSRELSGGGYTGYVIPVTTAGASAGQAIAILVKGSTDVVITVTDPRRSAEAL